jgi:cobyrinic acid a,c-diamide synthase
MRALIIAAPASHAGKTVVTLGLLRALRNRGICVASAKVGPDYIDPRFHEAATGAPCFNLDPWAMDHGLIGHLLGQLDADLIIIEGVMGLFDGPDGARGSTADLAEDLDLPVVLVNDVSRQAQSIGPVIHGFATYRKSIDLAGVILNRVASERHRDMLNTVLQPVGISVLGSVMRDDGLLLPSRHLGLVQASEKTDIDAFIDTAAHLMAKFVDLDCLVALARPPSLSKPEKPLPPLGQRIALASDTAFAFAYPHLVQGWQQQGAQILPFSPLADEAPDRRADAVFLPGGYPELHAGTLAANGHFLDGLRTSSALIYGECGGFMVMGEYLIDAGGKRHRMAGLLPVETSFEKRQLHLGYRQLAHSDALPWPTKLKGHEFHYSSIDWQGDGEALFKAHDAADRALGPMGLRRGKIMGSYAHVIA